MSAKDRYRGICSFIGAALLAALLCFACFLPACARAEETGVTGETIPLIHAPGEGTPAYSPAPAEAPLIYDPAPSDAPETLPATVPEPAPPTPEPTCTPAPAPSPEPFAPEYTGGVLQSYRGKPIPAEELRPYFDHEGALTLRYLEEPDWNLLGFQAAAVLATAETGQVFAQPVVIRLIKDTEPPVLHGVQKLRAYIDETALYLDGIWAEDNADSAPVVTVDTSKVNTHMAGTYKITYTATDYSGNSVRVKTEIALMEPKYTSEYVHSLAAEVLAQITTEDMTTTEKLRAAFDWGRSHIKYGYGIGNKDWRRAAVMGFTKGTGDCFVFYACSRAMLDELGVKYMSIERLGSHTHHYWVLVDVGTGWYHFDTTVANQHKHKCFMWTNEQCQVKPYFWRYDHNRFPETATEPFDYEAQVARERAAMKNE